MSKKGKKDPGAFGNSTNYSEFKDPFHSASQRHQLVLTIDKCWMCKPRERKAERMGWCESKLSRIMIQASEWCRQRLWFFIGLDSLRGSSVPQGKGEAFGGRSSCFHLGKHGQLPVETLPLYFRKLPKSLEENNMFPFQRSWVIRRGPLPLVLRLVLWPQILRGSCPYPCGL